MPTVRKTLSGLVGGWRDAFLDCGECGACAGVIRRCRLRRRRLSTTLRLYNTHTNEKIDIVYRRGDQYIQGALAKLDYFLRDHNTNEVRHFDPRLYDILSDLTASVGHPGGEIDIVCGYRTYFDECGSSRAYQRRGEKQPAHSGGGD